MADELIVVGGGAAGMMAAISAAETGAAVRLLERNPKSRPFHPWSPWRQRRTSAEKCRAWR